MSGVAFAQSGGARRGGAAVEGFGPGPFVEDAVQLGEVDHERGGAGVFLAELGYAELKRLPRHDSGFRVVPVA